ncbi:ubiquinone/menaquinone biosynthesis C-methyltransferase UbiE [Litorimonas cladophorae]|uniref:Ubiquinone/menaquinone biosynthesis C-methyltransferase UbiE n=1 Tax=Litorimonas cladophorae TaxID=1220491 RepID=A0A918NHI8_9PROT|nr:bifunctional demethylmenaquinone methyltransferase/2-methoxy-6-polyprenyl-1,4-benzoquinol methylase UbiE [Litorimonas cladophorae]GGX68085.1 ubiquinone/menaquinone biosynthesis C-methyltransferase UbiE [Litorimonas cladophorae]
MSDKTIDFGFETIPEAEKISRVKGVFDSVASNYDLMNDAMSVGIHRVWKNMTITRLNPQPGERLLDVAGGTGDIARRFIRAADEVRMRRGGEPASAVVCDINDQMLLAGIDPEKDRGLNLTRICGNAECLPFEDGQFDAVTISFGIRNVTDRMEALREFRRVLKPGGRLGILEFTTPPAKFIQAFYDAYSFAVIPRLGQILTGDRDSYQYLVESIRKFPRQEVFAEMIREAGFAQVSYQDYSTGIAALHTGWKL